MTPAITGRLSDLRYAAVDGWVVTGRNLRHFVRQPQLLIFSTVQPVMFVLLFAFVFGGAIEDSLPAGVDYTNFLIPGILIQTIAFRATQTAIGLAEDLERGVIDRFRSLPAARSAVLVGRTVADLVRGIIIVLLMVAVGYLIGFRFQAGVSAAIGAILLVAAFGFALSWIFAFIGLTVRGSEAVQSASFVGIFPLVFASSVFVPIETMPEWLRGFAAVNPITVVTDATRTLTLGGSLGGSLLAAFAWIVVIVAVFAPLAVWRYRRAGS